MTSIGSPSPFLFGGKKAYSVDRSLRFNSDDDTYLNRTPSGAGNTKTFTISFWFKMTSIPESASMNAIGTGVNNQNDFMIGFSYDGDRSMNIIGNEDFISHISCSYKDKM